MVSRDTREPEGNIQRAMMAGRQETGGGMSGGR